VSVGILGTLGVSGALILLSARRAERLARQQMEFVAGVTHELHTPLAAICSAGQNLADGVVKEPEQVRRYGSVIHKEGTRLSSTVGQILDFSGIQAGGRVYRSEPVAIGVLAEGALADNALAIREAGMTAELEVAEGLPEIPGDAEALRRAIGNLIGNAVKFAASGGWLRVAASLDASKSEVQIGVEDRGPGLSGEDRRRLFEPFYRGESAEAARVRGSGLGLSIVAHIAEGHGGRASARGRPEGGAAFVIHLPIDRGGRA
jgi:signal transduction histidine kinase